MRYCINDRCKGNFIGISEKEKNCPYCNSTIHTRFGLELNEIKNDVKNLGNKIGRKRMKQGLIGLLAGSAITVGSYFGYEHINTLEYKRGKELDKKIAYIWPYERTKYTLDDKDVILEAKRDFNIFIDCKRMHLTLDNIEFVSEPWSCVIPPLILIPPFFISGLDTYREDARNLSKLISDGNIFEKNGISDYEFWQKTYEDLIEKLAENKSQMLEKHKERLQEAKKKFEKL